MGIFKPCGGSSPVYGVQEGLRIFDAKGAAMTLGNFNFEVSRLGEGRIPSPLKGVYFVKDDEEPEE